MTIIDKIKDLLRMLAENIHKRRRVVLALSCVVVFVTTYMLILPAFTLEKTKAAEQGGIDVPGVTTTAEDVSEEDADANDGQADADDAQAETGKTEDGKAEDSGLKSKDSGETKADSAQTADPLTFEDEHYTIAVDDKNSVLPENTEIKVEEIDKAKDEKEYQKHFDDALAAIQEEKDGENVSDLEFARFYDISLVSDGKEVTLGNGDKVSVNIEYDKELRKALGVENKDNIRIIHFAENKDTGKVEAEVLDNKEAKVTAETTEDNLLKEAAFDADSFSVYGLVYVKEAEEDASQAVEKTEETAANSEIDLGTAVVSTVDGSDLPEDVDGHADVVAGKKAIAAVEKKVDDIDADKTEYKVFDIALENIDESEYKDGFKVDVTLPEEIKGKDFRLFHIHDGKVDELDVQTNGSKTVDGFTFETENFSQFVLSYTVDFEYDGYKFVLDGEGKIKLSDLFSQLHIKEDVSDVQDVSFSDESLVKVSKRFLGKDWVIKSLKPFSTEETLTVTMNNGSKYIINVTDAQDVSGNKYITDAQLTIDGTTYGKDDTWHVYPDVGYDLKLSFAEKGSNQFPKGGDTLVIDIPEGLTFAEDGQHHTFNIPAGLAGTITGNEYWVEGGKLYVKFGPDPDEILRRSSNAHFEIEFTAKFDEGTTKVEFNDKVKPNVEMDTTADVSVNKSASYNSETGKMDYTITVSSTGNSENVVVSDRMATSNLLTIDQNSIVVEPSGTQYSKTPQGNGFDMTIPSIGHNQTVTIKYSADVNTAALDHKGNIKVANDGKNTVTVENDDHSHDEETNTYNHQIKYSNTAKTSTSVDDHETASGENKTATIGWKVTVNDNYRGSIVGDKITDTIHYDNREAMKYTKNSDGTVTLSIVAKSQDGTTYNKTVNATVTTNSNGQESWEYTIPSFTNDPNEVLSYEISYTTEVDKTKLPSYTNGVVKNNVDNEGDGGSQGTGVVPGVTPHGGDEPGHDDIVGGKSAVNVTPEYIDWDIVVAIPAEGYTDKFVIVDEIPNGAALGRKFADTFDSIISVTGLHDNEDYVSVVTKESHNNLTPKQKDILTLTFYQDKAHTDPGLDSSQATRTLTIRVRTKNDPDWVNFADTANGGEQAIYHTNKAKVNDISTFTDKAAPLHTRIDKEKERNVGTETVDGVELQKYEYSVVLTNVTELPIVIKDTFDPDELLFVGGGDPYSGHDTIAADSQKNSLNGGVPGYKATFDASTDGELTITATDLPKKPDGSFYEFYKIYYTMRVKDKAALDSFTQKAIANGGTYKIGNTVEWNGTGDHVDIDHTVPTIEKSGSFRVNQGESGNDRLYDFSIDINKDKLKLNNGEPMDLTDTHTDNLTVDYTTVKVYKYENGEKKLDKTIEWNFDGNIGTFYNLQDETHYSIEYSCLVIGSGNQSFSNYAEMKGFHSEKHDSRDFGNDASGGADVLQIGLIKYKNGMTSRGLEGAKFQLFRGTGNYTWTEDENGNRWGVEEKEPMTWGVGDETAGKVGENITFTTNSDGYVQIALNQSDHGAELEAGVHYYLKEIESPPGYEIDSSVEYWEFSLTFDPDEVCYGTERDEYNNRKWIYFYYDDILKMNNTETDEPITVDVDKKWFDINGNEMDNPQNLTATVQLYQKKNSEAYKKVQTITNEDGTTYNGTIQLPYNGAWEFKWENLPRVDSEGNAYAYKLEEVNVSDGYASSVSLNETENEKSYHIENHRVQERKINVSVQKQWFEEDGTTVVTDNIPDKVRFYLYRVASRTPFSVAPKSGGNPYNIDGSPYLVTGSDAKEGFYEISKDEYAAGITFDQLPSVEKDTNGNWMFYSYYVKEEPVEGFNATVDVHETIDATSNTVLLTSMKNTKKPSERTTSLDVNKVWKDKEGNAKSWPSNTSVRFKLYQVTGKKPFTDRPTSGGVLYDVKDQDGNYHASRVDEGTYELKADRTSVSFTGLPEVTVDDKDNVTYYAYYVEEVEVTGYESSYNYTPGEDGSVTVDMINQQEPEYTSLSVTKKWYDGETEITGDELNDLEATVELVRYRAEPTGTTVHFINAKAENDTASILVPRNTNNITINIDSITGGNQVVYSREYSQDKEDWAYTSDDSISTSPLNSGTQSIVVNTPDVSDIWVITRYGNITSLSVSTDASPSGGEPELDTSFMPSLHRHKLDSGNDFSYTYSKLPVNGKGTDGKTYVYSYGIREVSNPSGFAFNSYIDAGVNESDTTEPIKASNPATNVTVKNVKTAPEKGGLKLAKNVTVNGSETQTQLADGEYEFAITSGEGIDPAVYKTVTIKVESGVATKYKVDRGTFTNLPADKFVVIDELDPGQYTITETIPTNGTVLSKINGNTTEQNSTVVTVAPGEVIEADATAVFTNDYQTTDFEFTKEWHNDAGVVESNWENGLAINVNVKRKIGLDGSPENVGSYVIRKTTDGFQITKSNNAPTLANVDGTFTFKLTDLPKSGKIGDVSGEYIYFATETEAVDGYKDPEYSNPSATNPDRWTPSPEGALNGGKIINKPVESYELPHTGGIGTVIFYILGSILVIGGGIYFISRRRAMK